MLIFELADKTRIAVRGFRDGTEDQILPVRAAAPTRRKFTAEAIAQRSRQGRSSISSRSGIWLQEDAARRRIGITALDILPISREKFSHGARNKTGWRRDHGFKKLGPLRFAPTASCSIDRSGKWKRPNSSTRSGADRPGLRPLEQGQHLATWRTSSALSSA